MVRTNPYIGPNAFTSENQSLFFGRENEAYELSVLAKAQKSLLFYGKSGTGKTSLLQASLIPKLSENHHVLGPIRVRGNSDTDSSILSSHLGIYMANAARQLAPEIENTLEVPTSLLQVLETFFIDDKSSPRIKILIFDQFEELFTSYPHRWEDRKLFFEQLASAMETDNLLRVMFVMREDYLADFTRYSGILPNNIRARYQLRLLRPEQAIDAIVKPAHSQGKQYTDEALDVLIQRLRAIHDLRNPEITDGVSEFVEPVVLQVVCQQLWEAVLEEQTEITIEDINAISVEDSLQTYYLKCLEEVLKTFPNNEWDIRKWFSSELIYRDLYRQSLKRTGDKVGDLEYKIVQEIGRHHIIRREDRDGHEAYELVHDTFVYPIIKENRSWFEGQRVAPKPASSLQTTNNQNLYLTHDSDTLNPNRLERMSEELWQVINPQKRDIALADFVKFISDLLLSHNAFFNTTPAEAKIVAEIRSEISGNEEVGEIIEYLLEDYSREVGRKDGDVYTPPSLARLMVALINPTNGEIFDPYCRTGNLLFEAARVAKQGNSRVLKVYGNGLPSSVISVAQILQKLYGLRGTISELTNNKQKSFSWVGSYDYSLCNPPFNQISEDFAYDIPQEVTRGTANYLWLQVVQSSLNERGRGAILMPNSVADSRGRELEIRRELISSGELEAIISIGTNFFFSQAIACMIWVFNKSKPRTIRRNSVLMVDASEIFAQKNRSQRVFSPTQIKFIADILQLYREEQVVPVDEAESDWLKQLFVNSVYENVEGLCEVVDLKQFELQSWSANPSRYIRPRTTQISKENPVGFQQRLREIRQQLRVLNQEANLLNQRIDDNLRRLLGD